MEQRETPARSITEIAGVSLRSNPGHPLRSFNN
jgi:hypothetical protein